MKTEIEKEDKTYFVCIFNNKGNVIEAPNIYTSLDDVDQYAKFLFNESKKTVDVIAVMPNKERRLIFCYNKKGYYFK